MPHSIMSRAAIAAIAASLSSVPAAACLKADLETAIIHSARPAILPAGLIVADVEFERAEELALYGDGIKVRVKEMIQGDARARTMIVRAAVYSSCSRPFANGFHGIVVAIPRGWENGILVVYAVEVRRGSGFRVRDGWQLPPGDTQKVALKRVVGE
jgi:hypothetical protein